MPDEPRAGLNVQDCEGSAPDRFVTQTILHDPELAAQGVYGNCLQACVATMFHLPLDAVPHFAAFHWWPQALTVWAFGKGLRVKGRGSDTIPDGPLERSYIVGGKSPRGVAHVVVGKGGEIEWDPHPSHDGLVSITDLTWFEPIEDVDAAPVPLLWGGLHTAHALRAHGYTVIEPEGASVESSA